MKKTTSLLLVLLILLSTLSPTKVDAARTSETKAEELFNKSVIYFEPINKLNENEIKSFVTKELLSKVGYDFFVQQIMKREDLANKLGKGIELKEHIDRLITDENISLFLKDLKIGKDHNSITIIEEFINKLEKLFDKDWDDIIDNNFKNSARILITQISESIDKESEKQFEDIKSHWGKEHIQAMIDLKILNGFPDKTFKPDNNVTRAEFSKMIVTALKLKNINYTGDISDVPVDQWHSNYISTMIQNKLALGYPNGTFNPNGNITRNEISVIISKVLKLKVNEEEQHVLLSNFNDSVSIPDWAKTSIVDVAKTEIMKGDTSNNFNPLNNATRAEAATVILRLLKYQEACRT